MEGSRAISQTQQMCWQPQAFGYFHRETGKIGKIQGFLKVIYWVLRNNFLPQQFWAVRPGGGSAQYLSQQMVCYLSLCLYLTSAKSAPLTQGYSLEIFVLINSFCVIYFGPLILISGININLNQKAVSLLLHHSCRSGVLHFPELYC